MSMSLKQLLLVTTWLTLTLGNYHDIGCTSAEYNETKTLNSSNSIIVKVEHIFVDKAYGRNILRSENITLVENQREDMEFLPVNTSDVSEFNPRRLYLWYDGVSVKAFMGKIVKKLFGGVYKTKTSRKDKENLMRDSNQGVCECEECEKIDKENGEYKYMNQVVHCFNGALSCECVKSECTNVTLSYDSGNTTSNLTFSWYYPEANSYSIIYDHDNVKYKFGYDVIQITLIPHQVYINIPTSASPDVECFDKKFPELNNTVATQRTVALNVTQMLYEQEQGIRLETRETTVNLTEGVSTIVQMKYISQRMFEYIEPRNLTMLYIGNYVYVGMAHLLDNRWTVSISSALDIDFQGDGQALENCASSNYGCGRPEIATNYYTSNWTCSERNITLDIIAMNATNDASSDVNSQGIEFYTYINSNSKERNIEYLNFTLYVPYSGCAGFQVFEAMLLTIFLILFG